MLQRQILLSQHSQAGLSNPDALLGSTGFAAMHGQLDSGIGGSAAPSNQMLLQLLQQQQHQQSSQHRLPSQFMENPTTDQISLGLGNTTPAMTAGGQLAESMTARESAISAVGGDGSTATKKKTYKKRPKDKPKRPLSAYNFFFKEERARILGGANKDNDNSNDKSNSSEKDTTANEMDSEESAGDDNKESDGKAAAPRKGRSRPHGKISFEDLGRLISQRWQELNPDEVEYYKKKSDEDRKRYQQEMDGYRKKKASN